jgi:D-lactate dehydrogenase
MKVALFSTKPHDRQFCTAANERHGHELVFKKARLTAETVPLAEGFSAISLFVNDRLDAAMLERLAPGGLQLVALRSAGFNHVDVEVADRLGVHIARVPAYSPHSVSEHTLALILSLARRVHRAYARVREGNFALEGLLGMEIHGKTVGIIGTGKIGALVCQLMRGMGCRVLAFDVAPNPRCEEAGVEYLSLAALFEQSDIISLHCPLTPDTFHIIDEAAIAQMKRGVMLVNTSRGALVDTKAVIVGLKSGQIGSLALDTYEEEEAIFFEDLSNQMIDDDVFSRLLTFPNVLITGHQGFFTQTALEAIAETTLANITAFEQGDRCTNAVTTAALAACR